MSYGREVAREAHDLLVELARIPAPSRDEGRRAEFVRSWLAGQGIGSTIDEALNAVSSYGVDPTISLAVFSAHTDVVFPDTDPLPLAEGDGRIYAPGVGDDTANLVCMLLAYRELVRRIEAGELIPVRGIVVVANACEEGLGNLDGTKAIFERIGPRVATFVSFDCYAPSIVTVPVGSHRWRIACDTPGGHSYSDFGKPSAIERLAAFIGAFYALRHDDEGKITVNVGRIEGGTTVNAIAQHAEALIEYRSTSEECLEAMRGRLEELVGSMTEGDVRFELELLGVRPGMGNVRRKAHEHLIATCSEVMERVTGREAQRGDASTDANVPLSMGIPAVTVGAIRGGGAHTREEWLDAESLVAGVDCALGIMERLVCA